MPRLIWLTQPASGKDGIDPKILQGYPQLCAMIDKLLALPQIVEYYENTKPLR